MKAKTPRKCVVIGHGRAGNSRVRTIQDNEGFELLAHIPSRSFSTAEIPSSVLVFVCSDNASHYSITNTLLLHGCDVIVEFPPCSSQQEWRNLTMLAKQQSCRLHCALIGLYTSAHLQRKKTVQTNSVHTIDVHFTGGLYRWVLEEARGKNFPQLAFGRLAALWDLCGPLEVLSLQYTQEEFQYRFLLQMHGANGQHIQLTEHRMVNGPRATTWILRDQNGTVVPTVPSQKEDLFAMDLEYMHNKNSPPIDIDALYALIDSIHNLVHRT